MLGRDSEDEIWSRFVFELVIWTQPSGPLCLWQCLNFTSIVWSLIQIPASLKGERSCQPCVCTSKQMRKTEDKNSSQEPTLLIMKRRVLKTGIRPHSYLVKDENSNSRFRMHMMSTVVLCKIRKKTFDSCRVLHPTNNLDLSAWVEKSLPPNQVHHPLSPSSITNLWHQSLSPPTNIQNWTIHHVEKGVLQKQNIFLEMKHRHFSWDTRWYTYVPPDIPRKVSVFHFNINFLIY